MYNDIIDHVLLKKQNFVFVQFERKEEDLVLVTTEKDVNDSNMEDYEEEQTITEKQAHYDVDDQAYNLVRMNESIQVSKY